MPKQTIESEAQPQHEKAQQEPVAQPPSPPVTPQQQLFFQRHAHTILAASLLALFAFFVLWNLGNYYLWSDEGETGFYARTILKFGLPLGYDGRNLYEYRSGMELNRNFLNVYSPWLQFYLAAGSIALFGVNTLAARLPFALCGIAAVWMTYLFARRFYSDRRVGLLSLLLAATNVQFILFMRQARYYSPIALLFCLLAYACLAFEGRRRHQAAVGALYLLWFVANPMVGAAAVGAVFIAMLLFAEKKRVLRLMLLPAPAVLAIVIGFQLWLHKDGAPPNPDVLRNFHPADFLLIAWHALRDYSEFGLMPFAAVLGFVAVAVASRLCPGRKWSGQLRQDAQLWLTALLFTLFLSIISPQLAMLPHSDIRYYVAIFPVLFILQASLFVRLYGVNRLAGAALVAIAIFTNLLSLQLPLRSYLKDYVQENLHPFPNALRITATNLQQQAKQDETVLVSPNYNLGSMLFYLTDKLYFRCSISETNQVILPYHPELPRFIYSSAYEPDWVVLLGNQREINEDSIAQHIESLPLSSHYQEVDLPPLLGLESSRPEIFWRFFRYTVPKDPNLMLRVFHKLSPSIRPLRGTEKR